MTDRPGTWTRRQFSQALAAAAASSLLERGSSAATMMRSAGIAFVGTDAHAGKGIVRVFRSSGTMWSETHAVNAPSPAHLVIHPSLPILYVVHDVPEWNHRPRGAVSAYHFDSARGRLTHAGTQPLSLSATNPRHAVVVADGHALFVAAHTGGIYNVLPIDADGTLQPVSAIRKEVGLQDGGYGRTAAPGRMVLDADGSVYAEDAGLATVTRFAVDRNAITMLHRSDLHAAKGPAVMRLKAESQQFKSLQSAFGSEGSRSILLI